MHKKLQLFYPSRCAQALAQEPDDAPGIERTKFVPTKNQVIAAAEYAKDPDLIELLSASLAFVREDTWRAGHKNLAAKKKGGLRG